VTPPTAAGGDSLMHASNWPHWRQLFLEQVLRSLPRIAAAPIDPNAAPRAARQS